MKKAQMKDTFKEIPTETAAYSKIVFEYNYKVPSLVYLIFYSISCIEFLIQMHTQIKKSF